MTTPGTGSRRRFHRWARIGAVALAPVLVALASVEFSAALGWAQSAGYVAGDADCDGATTNADARAVLVDAVGHQPQTSCEPDSPINVVQCDMSGDGQCLMGDAMIIAQCVVGESGLVDCDIGPPTPTPTPTPTPIPTTAPTPTPVNPNSRAAWMEGGWGVRVALPWAEFVTDSFDLDAMIETLDSIPDAEWVMFNVSRSAGGDKYTAPIPWLQAELGQSIAPDRDLLGEALVAARALGYRTLVYFESTGPLMDKYPQAANPTVTQRWKNYVARETGAFTTANSRRLVGDQIVGWFSQKYGTLIDGWWFDHGSHGDIAALARGARSGNPDAVVTSIRGSITSLQNQSPGIEDYTNGHVNSIQTHAPTSPANWAFVTTIENSGPYIQASLGHIFMPSSQTWLSGDVQWTDAQALEWVSRTICANGAWTWSIPMARLTGRVFPDAADLLKTLGETIAAARLDPAGPEAELISCRLPPGGR